MEMVPPAALGRCGSRPDLRIAIFRSNAIAYGRFNLRAPTDTSRPHPVLADPAVRQALVRALNRATLARSAYGPNALVPDAAQSVAWSWVAPIPGAPAAPDAAAIRRALVRAGWRDSNDDGILDERRAAPPRPCIPAPVHSVTSSPCKMQAMWRASGRRRARGEGRRGYTERRNSGRFDVELVVVNQDPSPMSLTQSWSCASAREARSSNNARWCDPEFDRLLAAAIVARNPADGYRAALARMAVDAPAAFLAAPYKTCLHARLENVRSASEVAHLALAMAGAGGAELPRTMT